MIFQKSPNNVIPILSSWRSHSLERHSILLKVTSMLEADPGLQPRPGYQLKSNPGDSRRGTFLVLLSFILAYYCHLWLYCGCSIVVSSLKQFAVRDGGLNIYTIKVRTALVTPNLSALPKEGSVLEVGRSQLLHGHWQHLPCPQGHEDWQEWGSVLCTLTGFLSNWKFLEDEFFKCFCR